MTVQRPRGSKPQTTALCVTLTPAGDFALFFPYDLTILSLVKTFPGWVYDPESRGYTLPGTPAGAERLKEICDTFGFSLSEEAVTAAAKLSGEFIPLNRASKARTKPTAPLKAKLKQKLYPYQLAGVAYILRTRCCFVADEMGLGKTSQALAAAEEAFAYPLVVVCPSVVKYNWAREAKNWLPNSRRILVITDGAQDFSNADLYDVVIVSYGLLARTQYVVEDGRRRVIFPMVRAIREAWLEIKMVVADESHYIKNPNAKRSKACVELAARVQYRLALTGTPIMNRPIEAAGQLNFLGRLQKDFKGYWAYAKQYCNAKKGRFGMDVSGSSNLDELNNKLRSTCYIRRTKLEVLPELPEKQACSVYLELSDRDTYIRARQELEAWAEDEGRNPADAMVKFQELKHLAAQLKLKAVISWVEDFLQSGEKLVLFGWHKDLIETLRLHFGSECVTVTGEVSSKNRQVAVDRFQTDPKCKIFLGNLQAAGVGITLTAASNVAFYEFGWTPGEHEQAEDRCHRIGQKSSVMAWYLVAGGTVEEEIIELLGRKQGVVVQATDGHTVQQSKGKTILHKLLQRVAKK